MFSIVWGEKVEGHRGGKSATIYANDQRICNLNTWAFASCACYSLQNFYGQLEITSKEVDLFFQFLTSEKCKDSWLPNEIYFLLSEYQLRELGATALIKHPNVRLRDQFTNKAHGEGVMNLYRYSTAQDFKHIP